LSAAAPKAKKMRTEESHDPNFDLSMEHQLPATAVVIDPEYVTADEDYGTSVQAPPSQTSFLLLPDGKQINANVLTSLICSSSSSSSISSDDNHNDNASDDAAAAVVLDSSNRSDNGSNSDEQEMHPSDRMKAEIIRLVKQKMEKLQQEQDSSSSDVSLNDLSSEEERRRKEIKKSNKRKLPAAIIVNIACDDQAAAEDGEYGNANSSSSDENDGEELDKDPDELPVPIEHAGRNAEADLVRDFFDNLELSEAANDEDAQPAAVIASGSKEPRKSILQIEVEARIKSIRDKDPRRQVTWPNVMMHLTSLLNFPQRHATILLQLLKAAEKELSDSTKLGDLPSTGKTLMDPPKAEMTAARIKYM
jgi:hypothetical protein